MLGRGYICQLLACSCFIFYNVRSENPKGCTVHERDTPGFNFHAMLTWLLGLCWKIQKSGWKHTQGTQDTPKYTVLKVYSTYMLGRGYICQLLACSCFIFYNVRSENPKGCTVHERDTPGFNFHAMLTWLLVLVLKKSKNPDENTHRAHRTHPSTQ